jgi:ParB-like chromosome segregation protein Spo0J
MIAADLEGLAFPVDRLTPLPDNPRRGDVQAVARSYATFGQRKPIVARREGEGGIVIAGNHQLAAAEELGWDEIAVVWVDDDDITAKAFALADNRTADALATDPTWTLPPHVDLIDQLLVRVAAGELRRLIVTVPVRHGKSEMCSRYFPAWLLGMQPTLQVVVAGYAAWGCNPPCRL